MVSDYTVVEEPPEAYLQIFYFYLKNIWLASELIKSGCRMLHKIFDKTMQNKVRNV